MNSKKRSIFFIAFAAALIAGTLAYQNCDGTRTRSSNIDVSTAQAESNLSNLVTDISSGTVVNAASGSAEASALNEFVTYSQNEGVTLYYSESPLMGSPEVVAPLDYSLIVTNGGSTGVPTLTQIYFAFSNANGAQGDLVISGNSTGLGGSTTVSPTPLPSASPTSGGAATSGAINFVEVGINDGSNSLAPGTIDENGLDMTMTLSNGTTLELMSTDTTSDGDLTDVIQLSVYQLDSSGNQNYVGLINLINTDAE